PRQVRQRPQRPRFFAGFGRLGVGWADAPDRRRLRLAAGAVLLHDADGPVAVLQQAAADLDAVAGLQAAALHLDVVDEGAVRAAEVHDPGVAVAKLELGVGSG